MSRRHLVLGCPVDVLDPAAFKASLPALADADHLTDIVTLNPEQIMAARREPAVAELFRAAQFCTVDGVGLALALRAQGVADVRLVVDGQPATALGVDVGERAVGQPRPVARPQPGHASDDTGTR